MHRLHSLTYLDLANNFFQAEGFEALGQALQQTTTLEHLLLSHNSGGFPGRPPLSAALAAQPLGAAGERAKDPGPAAGPGASSMSHQAVVPVDEDPKRLPPEAAPLAILVEHLGLNRSICTLDLSCTNMSAETALVLEGSLIAHPYMRTLLCADNPFGEAGTICMARYVCQADTLEWVDLSGTREAAEPMHCSRKRWDHLNPSGRYVLSLKHPYDRQILWRVLFWCHCAGVDPQTALKDVDYEPPPPPPVANAKAKAKPKAQAKKKKPVDLATLVPKETDMRWPGDTTAFPRWRIPKEGQLALNLDATEDLAGPDDIEELLICWARQKRLQVTLKRFLTLSVLWRTLTSEAQRRMMVNAIAKTCLLKPPQIGYLLRNAERQMHLDMIRELMPCCALEPGAFALQRLAVVEFIPNARLRKLLLRECRSMIFFCAGNATGRYNLNLLSPLEYEVAERMITVNAWHAGQASRVREDGERLADTTEYQDRQNFRNTSLNGIHFRLHKKWFLPAPGQLGHLDFDYVQPTRVKVGQPRALRADLFERMRYVLWCSPVPLYNRIRALRAVFSYVALTPNQLRVLLEDTPTAHQRHARDVMQAAAEYFDEPRVELFVLLWARVAHRRAVVSPRLLYDGELLKPSEAKKLARRLGRLNTFDVQNICQMVRSNVAGNSYEFNFAVNEQRQMFKMLLILAVKEEGDNMRKTWYSEYKGGQAKGPGGLVYDYIVPQTWTTDLPTTGVFRVEYYCEKPEYNLAKVRHSLAVKYQNILEEDPEDDDGLDRDETPRDMRSLGKPDNYIKKRDSESSELITQAAPRIPVWASRISLTSGFG